MEVYIIMTQPLIVTLDHNAIIALEHADEPHEQPIAEAVRELIRYHDAGYIALKITSSTMLENPQYGKDPDIAKLIAQYQDLGLGSLALFQGPQSLVFTDGKGTIFANTDQEQLFLRKVHMLIHPNIDFDLGAYRRRYCKDKKLDEQEEIQIAKISGYQWMPLDAFAARAEAEQIRATRPDLVCHSERINRKWNNAKCDALGLCTHASWGGTIFVTNDDNFYGHKHDELERLTNSYVIHPCEAIAVLRSIIAVPEPIF
jgi:hypothetical protein